MIRNFRRVLNKGTFSFLCSKLKVAWWKDWAQDDPFLWGWQTRGPSCCISSSLGWPFSGSLLKWKLLVSFALHTCLCKWEWWDCWWLWGESFPFSTLSRTIIVLGAGVTSLVFWRDVKTKMSSLSLGSWKVILWCLGFPSNWDLQGLVTLNF